MNQSDTQANNAMYRCKSQQHRSKVRQPIMVGLIAPMRRPRFNHRSSSRDFAVILGQPIHQPIHQSNQVNQSQSAPLRSVGRSVGWLVDQLMVRGNILGIALTGEWEAKAYKACQPWEEAKVGSRDGEADQPQCRGRCAIAVVAIGSVVVLDIRLPTIKFVAHLFLQRLQFGLCDAFVSCQWLQALHQRF
jgi:hypothetical protein